MADTLTGKVAIVTGAGRGIGRGIAIQLAAEGASVVGKLDIVVTPAGILRDRMVFNMTEEEWDAVIAVHLKGTFSVVKHACILFRQQRSGRVITFSSESGLVGNTGQVNYGAAKSGIAGFTKVVARDPHDSHHPRHSPAGPGRSASLRAGDHGPRRHRPVRGLSG